jgi:hypothetical protein
MHIFMNDIRSIIHIDTSDIRSIEHVHSRDIRPIIHVYSRVIRPIIDVLSTVFYTPQIKKLNCFSLLAINRHFSNNNHTIHQKVEKFLHCSKTLPFLPNCIIIVPKTLLIPSSVKQCNFHIYSVQNIIERKSRMDLILLVEI